MSCFKVGILLTACRRNGMHKEIEMHRCWMGSAFLVRCARITLSLPQHRLGSSMLHESIGQPFCMSSCPGLRDGCCGEWSAEMETAGELSFSGCTMSSTVSDSTTQGTFDETTPVDVCRLQLRERSMWRTVVLDLDVNASSIHALDGGCLGLVGKKLTDHQTAQQFSLSRVKHLG